MNANIFKVLGSGASEPAPAFMCDCPVCRNARTAGGKDRRMRTAYALGETIRFDFGADAQQQSSRFGLDGLQLAHLFITHSHHDHFAPRELYGMRLREKPVLHIYGNAEVINAAENLDFLKKRAMLHLLHAGDEVYLPDEKLLVTALPGDHISGEECLLYLLERNNKRLLIAADTGEFPEKCYDLLKNKPCNTIFIDCTWGMKDIGCGHMGLPANFRVLERLRAIGAADADTVMLPVHIGHNHTVPDGEFPIPCAWDGMEINF